MFIKKHKTTTVFEVKQDCTLEQLLQKHMQGKSVTSLKGLCAKGIFTVQGKPVKRIDTLLKAGQTVVMGKKPEPQFKMPDGIKIVFEDENLLVVNKAAGLLTVATQKNDNKTAYLYVGNYLKFYNPNAKVFVVHRLDRETSGLLLFAKNEETQRRLQENWNETHKRKYVAIVEGYPEEERGIIDTWLQEHPKSLKMSVAPDGEGQHAVTHYKVLAKQRGYALVEVTLETGRKNQIRVHMKHIGFPVAGDIKYGAKSNPINRLCLHARSLSFIHPFTGKQMNFDTGLPMEFGEWGKKEPDEKKK